MARLLFLFLFFLMLFVAGCRQNSHSLEDKRIVVTAPEIYATRLQAALESYDAEVVLMPAIETIVYDSLIGWQSMNHASLPAVELIGNYDFIVLPSRNAIKAFDNDMRRRSESFRPLAANYFVLGSDLQYLKELGYETPMHIQEPSMMGILTHIKTNEEYQGKKMLLVAPQVTLIDEPNVVPHFVEEAQKMGLICHRVNGYTTKPLFNSHSREVLDDIRNGEYDMIAFSSGGELFAIAEMCEVSALNCKIACFGPYTASNAALVGIEVDMVSEKFRSFDDYALSIAKFYE